MANTKGRQADAKLAKKLRIALFLLAAQAGFKRRILQII
jgi:hypothetical protein